MDLSEQVKEFKEQQNRGLWKKIKDYLGK